MHLGASPAEGVSAAVFPQQPTVALVVGQGLPDLSSAQEIRLRINVHAQLVLGQINVVPDRYSVSELESEYADGSEVDHSEEEDEGDRDMFWWLPVPTFPLPVYTKQPYYYPS